MEVFCDLHTHSTYSDGSLTPSALVAMACRLELGAIALTDHNSVAGLPEFLRAAEGTGVEAVAGIEVSTDYRGGELHILGLFLPPEAFPVLTRQMLQSRLDKERSNLELVAALAADGYRLDYEALKAATPDGAVNRAHIAAALTRLGYTRSVDHAFDTLLYSGGPYYRPPRRMDALDTVAGLRALGAVPVLAHPYLNLKPGALEEFLTLAVPRGLAGMETEYPLFDEDTRRQARAVCARFALAPGGGSDFHGEAKPDIAMGSGRNGNLRVPMALCHGLRQRR